MEFTVTDENLRIITELNEAGFTRDQIITVLRVLKFGERPNHTEAFRLYWDGDYTDPFVFCTDGTHVYRFNFYADAWQLDPSASVEDLSTYYCKEGVPTVFNGVTLRPLRGNVST